MMRKTFGALLLLAAALFLSMVLLALLDPAGTQLATVEAARGTHAGPTFYAEWLAVIAGFAGMGAWMLLGGQRKRSAVPSQMRG